MLFIERVYKQMRHIAREKHFSAVMPRVNDAKPYIIRMTRVMILNIPCYINVSAVLIGLVYKLSACACTERDFLNMLRNRTCYSYLSVRAYLRDIFNEIAKIYRLSIYGYIRALCI